MEAWAPYLKYAASRCRLCTAPHICIYVPPPLRDTALRVFASGSLTAQVGSFTRPVFDYSSASLRLDLGLTSMDYDASSTFKQRVRAGGA